LIGVERKRKYAKSEILEIGIFLPQALDGSLAPAACRD
jgi:hypothetical protein